MKKTNLRTITGGGSVDSITTSYEGTVPRSTNFGSFALWRHYRQRWYYS